MSKLKITVGKVEDGFYYKAWQFDSFYIICWRRQCDFPEWLDKKAEEWASTIDPNNLPTHGKRVTNG